MAKAAPHRARHSLTFARIVARRGLIDPSELVLRTQGARAMKNVLRIFRLLRAGKANIWKTLFGRNRRAAAAASKLIGKRLEGL